MKASFLIFCFISAISTLCAQNAKIDSLKKIIATTKVDTVKGRSLCHLCNYYRLSGDASNALQSGKEGLRMSENAADAKGISDCFMQLGDVFLLQGQYPKAIASYQRSEKIAQSLNDDWLLVNAWERIANIYDYQGSYRQALAYYEKSLKQYELTNNTLGIARTLNNLAVTYESLANYSKSLDYYQKSLETFTQLNQKRYMAGTLINIGIIYEYQKDYTKSLGYYRKGLATYENIRDTIGIAQSLLNIGTCYSRLNQLDQAQDYLTRSLELIKDKNDFQLKATIIGMLGQLCIQRGEFRSGLAYSQTAYRMCQQMDDRRGIVTALGASGYAYLELKAYPQAQADLSKSYRIGLDIGYTAGLAATTQLLYRLDSALSDYQSAFEHHKLFKQYSDSLHNEDKAKEFGRVESKYQFEKDAEEAKRKEAEAKRVAQIERDRSNNLQYLSIFAGLLVLFGGLAFVGKLKIPARVLDIALFAALLILFEFLLVLFDPLLDRYTGGIPIQKLVFNSVIALGFAPLHGFLEGKLRKRMSTTSESISSH